MAYNTLQELKIQSNDNTTVVLVPGANPGFGPEPQHPIASITIAYSSGKAPSDAIAGAVARAMLSIG